MKLIGGIPKKKQLMYSCLFLSVPLLLLILTFYVPVYSAFKLSLTDYDAISKPSYVGFKNFKEVLKDKVFWISLRNTFVYSLLVVPGVIVFSFLISLGLNNESKYVKILRIFYLLPLVTSSVAIALVWRWMYNPSYGIINTILGWVGIPPIKWLTEPKTALISLVIMGIWGSISYYSLIFLAGLKNIPKVYYEAAKIDGATKYQQILYITIPLISPTTFFISVMTIISSVQIFDPVFLLTNGGPGYSTYTLVFYIYQNGFYWFKMGYGMAVAWFVFIILLLLTLIQFILQKRWVHYA